MRPARISALRLPVRAPRRRPGARRADRGPAGRLRGVAPAAAPAATARRDPRGRAVPRGARARPALPVGGRRGRARGRLAGPAAADRRAARGPHPLAGPHAADQRGRPVRGAGGRAGVRHRAVAAWPTSTCASWAPARGSTCGSTPTGSPGAARPTARWTSAPPGAGSSRRRRPGGSPTGGAATPTPSTRPARRDGSRSPRTCGRTTGRASSGCGPPLRWPRGSQPSSSAPTPSTGCAACAPTSERLTVVWHSVVALYLPRGRRVELAESVAALGALAAPGSPVAWLRLEPEGRGRDVPGAADRCGGRRPERPRHRAGRCAAAWDSG